MPTFTSFSTSVLPVRQNAFKNILFRFATILLQITVYKVFSYLAFKSNSYTSFLMFGEDIIQKFLFIFSRGFTHQALLVVTFFALFTTAGFYDTLLWALDSPGFVIKSRMVDASTVAQQLLGSPAYIVYVSDPDIGTIDIGEATGANLFKPGFNFTLPGRVNTGTRETVASNQTLAVAGPRIWLDDAGFSVGVDQAVMISSQTFCPTRTIDANHQTWLCIVNNTEALEFVQWSAGMPEIWWDVVQSEYLRPNRRDNPWQSLGTGDDTAVMKQVFTVTKDRRRHTFLETMFKASMLTLYPTPFSEADISDLIRRMWTLNASQPITPQIQASIDVIISSQANQTSVTQGWFFQEEHSVTSSSIELLNVLNSASHDRLYSVFRIITTNITLIRSETLPEPVVPFAPCPLYFTNLATGGKVRSSTCAKSLGNQTGARFLGQLDTSSMLILTGALGDGTTSSSVTALNQTGLDWLTLNGDQIDRFLTSRGFILGVDPAAVQVEIKHNEAALSYLQLLLVVIPVLFVLVAWFLTTRDLKGYYGSSFLAAVCATTHVTDESACQRVGYLRVPPEFTLSTKGEHMLIETPTGTFVNLQVGQAKEDSVVMEPLLYHNATIAGKSENFHA